MTASTTALQRHSFFGGLTEEQIEKVFSMMTAETYPPDTCIIAEDTPNNKIYFILEGMVSVIKDNAVISELPEGSVFGEMEVMDIMPSSATIRTVTHVTVMSLSNTAMRQIYKDDLKSFAILLMNLARDISRRLRAANDKLSALLH